MTHLALLACLLTTNCLFAQQNLLPAGDFESTLAPWHCHDEKDARASAGVEAVEGAHGKQAAKIVVHNPGQSNHVQFTCNFDSSVLVPGGVYRLSFIAKADSPRPFSIHIIHANKPWGSVGLSKRLQMQPTWREYDLLFRAKQPKQDKVKVDFFLGEAAGTVWIDDVRLARAEARPPAPDGPKLEGKTWELSFSKTGAIQRFTHKPSGQRLVGGLGTPAAYELTLLRGGEAETITDLDAQKASSSGDEQARTFTFEHKDLTVTCTARRTAGHMVQFAIKVDNRGDAAIIGVTYPILNCPAKLGESSEDDQILYPRCDGGLIENPLAVMAAGQGLDDIYPGPLSCQLMAYCDGVAGLYLAAHDPAGHPKRFGCEMDVDIKLSIKHLFPILPGKSVALSYPVVMTAFTGDWYDAAEIYRKWSRQQPWCAKTIAEREDTPEWLRKGGMVTLYDPRAKTQEGKQRFSPEGLRDFLQKMTRAYGLPVIPNSRGWERYGAWCGQEYLPPYPSEEAFREDARIIRELGGQGMVMLSGYRWTIEKPQKDGTVYSSDERFEREVKPFVTCKLDGVTPWLFTSKKKNDWRGTRYARLCPATEFAKQTIVDVAKYCVQAGYTIIHFDQEVSGPASTSFCGSRDHGHPPGYGPWMQEAMADLFRRIRAACEPLDRDFALSMEEPNELYLPYLNLCQSRPNGLTNEFPMRAPLTRVAPLFSYLYHDYLVGWTAFYPWRSGGHPTYSLARGFSAGMMPGLHWESTARWPDNARNAFNAMLRNCNAAYAGPAHDYLVFGKMLKPLELNVPMRELNLGKKHGKTRVPAVSNSVWELPDGRRAVVLINPEQEDHTVELPGQGKTVTVPGLDVVVVEG